jgi:Tol biopolymer transport system component
VRPDLSTTEVGLVPFVQLPRWSPDSRHYAGITAEGVTVVSIEHPDEGRVVYRSISADDPRRQVPLQFVEWSPDGRRIAFVGFDPADETGERLALLVVDADGGGEPRVIATLDGLPLGAIGVLDW